MFRNRTNSQKPNDELIASFKASFPQLGVGSRASAAPSQNTTSALDLALHHFGDSEDVKDQDPTPRGAEQWRFTPSLMDPNSFAFASFANQPPGYYTPTPGGTNTIYHNQAGDLHTPGFTMGLGTPLSMPTSEGALQASQSTGPAMHGFQPHPIAPLPFQNPNPFAMPQQMSQAQSFAPHQFTHQPAPFDPMSQAEEPQMDGIPVDIEMQERSPMLSFAQGFSEQQRPSLLQQNIENFRWHVTLNAPTAMIKHADEVPVTYLNKGQAYSIAIVDTSPAPPQIAGVPVKYRTYIRISFEDEQQRQRPAACWQLWKEGRGTNEAHQRGGRLQAVEFVDPTQVGGGDGSTRPRVELESASFDGFSVTWTPGASANGVVECSVAVRFNFLSTDFSHSKGVKGIPVRLCAKTEQVGSQAPGLADSPQPEICYCKVKLFRDHGAERKLSNDVTHVKKTIDKLKQQIAQAESGMKDFGKRKRGSIAKAGASANDRPGKVPKHKRTWSMSSASSTGNRPSAEEDLHLKLATLQDMFTSTRPTSILYLKGEEFDDPDLHPVHLSGEPQDLTKVETGDSTMWDGQSRNSSIVSPTPSSQSVNSGERRSSTFQSFPPPSRVSSNEWRNMSQTATGDINSLAVQPTLSNNPVKVQKASADGSIGGWIDALGVDLSYQPPPERAIKPIACFYVQPRFVGRPPEDNYYRAVYLMQRTLKDLVNGIAMKCKLEPTRVVRTIRINAKGLAIALDDSDVLEMPEGQDMTAEFQEIQADSPMKREWDSGPTDVQVDGEVGATETTTTSGYELRLLF
ncbi:CP2 transcription factor [Lasiodiplodia theobromae]|uniref:Grainyhead-like protein 2-like protein n=1 Tax=Lasiodiplodia theobromae TaxID=45133 RepID=A0A5N5DEB6_9PEZI|nr:Grainyhead-like protein 2-like protein [Lasiodiplodia theobromae]KAF9638295.1 CP2 transcription factor [Lasiodiplodia theobromae]